MRKIIFLSFIALVSACNKTLTFEEAYKLYLAENYKDAIPQLQKIADKGDYRAQVLVGHSYLSGNDKNPEQAAKYLKLAANQGDSDAMYFLGGIYLEGRGVPQNESIALDYYQRAANANNPHGMFSLAFFYASKLRKEGKREDGLLAVKWSEQAFEYGCKVCALSLLNLYSYGPMHDEIQKVAWMLTYNSIKSFFESQQSKDFEPPYFWHGDERKKAGKLSQAKYLSILYSAKFASKKPANTVMNISSDNGAFYMR